MSEAPHCQRAHHVFWFPKPQHQTSQAPFDCTAATKPFVLKPQPVVPLTPLCPLVTPAPLLPPTGPALAQVIPPRPELNPIFLPTTEAYIVQITCQWLSPLVHTALNCAPTMKMNMTSITIPCKIALNSINHVQFLHTTLKAQGLDTYYHLTNKGPPFRIWWKGLKGGKTAAFTIRSNLEFEKIQNQILNKSPINTLVSVLYWVDEMTPFLNWKQVTSDSRFDGGGTHRPSIKPLPLSAPQEFHHPSGLQLKPEGSQPEIVSNANSIRKGFCYDTHAHITPLPGQVWFTALPLCKVTHKMPLKMAGVAGNHQATSKNSKLSYSSSPTTIKPRPPTDFPEYASPPYFPHMTGSSTVIPTNGVNSGQSTFETESKKLTPGAIISSSISAFQKDSGIDISEGQEYLEYHELTPDIIHAIPYQHLANILKVTEGKALKYQLFCNDLHRRLELESVCDKNSDF